MWKTSRWFLCCWALSHFISKAIAEAFLAKLDFQECSNDEWSVNNETATFTEHLLWEHNMLSALGRMSYPQNKLTRNWLLPHFTEEETKSQDNYGACHRFMQQVDDGPMFGETGNLTWISLTPSLCLFQVHHDVNLKLQVAPMFTPIIYNGQDMEISLRVHSDGYIHKEVVVYIHKEILFIRKKRRKSCHL